MYLNLVGLGIISIEEVKSRVAGDATPELTYDVSVYIGVSLYAEVGHAIQYFTGLTDFGLLSAQFLAAKSSTKCSLETGDASRRPLGIHATIPSRWKRTADAQQLKCVHCPLRD